MIKKTRQSTLMMIGTLVFVLLAVGVAAGEYDHIYAILEQLDSMSNFEGSDFSAVMTMVVEDGEALEQTVVRHFRRDREEQFLLLIQEPSVQRGQGYLLDGDNLWFYDPSSRRFSHSSLKESFQSSNARNSDFSATSYAQDYRVVEYSEGRLGSNDVYIIDLEATSDTVTYPYLKLWVTQASSLLLKSEDYSLNQRLMRTALYPSYARLGENVIPRQMIFIDELVEDQRTQITLSELSVNPIPDHVFTQAYVERVNR